ncbi:MAG: Gfo/Idh/MocA family oxidoreductase [Candidatus Bathyarchaeota archaeon]|jgi:predicted dehydrogenase
MLRLGIIGCGKVTTMFHLKAIAEVDEVEVVAVADLDRRRMEAVKKKAGAERGYLEPGELLEDGDVEAVAVNTPPRFHEGLTLEAIQAGKHVLVEKPLAQTIEGCKRIRTALKGSDLVVLPVHNYAFTPCLERAKGLLSGGEIGGLEGLEVRFDNNLWSYGAKTDFRMEEPHAIVEDLLPHILSVAHVLAGPVRRVVGAEGWVKRYPVFDNLRVELETEGGAAISGEMNWTSLIPGFDVRVRGERGTMSVELMKSPYSVSVDTPQGSRKIGGRGLGWLLDLVRLKHPAFVGQYRHLVRAVRGEELPRFTVEDEGGMLGVMDEVIGLLPERDITGDGGG